MRMRHPAVVCCSSLKKQCGLPSQIPPELANAFAPHDGLQGLQFDIPRTIDLKPTRTLLDFLPLVSEEKGI